MSYPFAQLVKQKTKELGYEYTPRQYATQILLLGGAAAGLSFLYLYSIPVTVVYTLIAIAFSFTTSAFLKFLQFSSASFTDVTNSIKSSANPIASSLTFVMFNISGDTFSNYKNGVSLISYGNYFKDGVDNEECLLKINNDYYAYLIIKGDVENTPVEVDKEENGSEEEGSTFKVVLMVLGSLAVTVLGYQIIKLRKRVRAA